METLLDIDKRLFLFLNGFHHSFFDPIILYSTETFFWLPLYAFLFFLIFKNYKRDSWLILGALVLALLLSDQITSTIMKPYFARLRPSQEPTLQGLVHLVNGYKGGLYGFASSHAANTFSVALFVWLTLNPFYRIGWIFLWATLMTYTRIYLGVHYPMDVFIGACIGLVSGWVGFRLSRWLVDRYGRKID